jgi:Kef-type K+ transport system membrane component KefB
VPEVVIQILFGIVLGPYVLASAHPNTVVTALTDFGLTYLMFLAGTELDLATMGQGRLRKAGTGWVMSLVLGLAVGAVLAAQGPRAGLRHRRPVPDDDGPGHPAPDVA